MRELIRCAATPTAEPDAATATKALHRYADDTRPGDVFAADRDGSARKSQPDCRVAREAGCEELWTEDLATGSELRGVRIRNPLKDD